MNTIEEALESLKRGDFVIVADDANRENEGDLILAAQYATPEKIAFLLKYTSGLVCCALQKNRADTLDLPLMVQQNSESFRTAFTVTVDAKEGGSTGISAADRARTLKLLSDPQAKASDFVQPGHILPLLAREGGVLKRAGHTESTTDLTKLANLEPVGILCELMNEDGTMMRMPELTAFAKEHKLPLITVADLIHYRRKTEKLIIRRSEAQIPTKFGNFTCYSYQSKLDQTEHVALVLGKISEQEILVRVHSECITGDIFGSIRCDCGAQLELAMEKIAKQGSGVIVYLRGHEGRGIGLTHKLRAYSLQEKGLDTVEANIKLGLPVDSREYGIGAQILADLGVKKIRLMTNNPCKYSGLEGYQIEIVGREPLISPATPQNHNYLQTKQEKLGHLLNLPQQEFSK